MPADRRQTSAHVTPARPTADALLPPARPPNKSTARRPTPGRPPAGLFPARRRFDRPLVLPIAPGWRPTHPHRPLTHTPCRRLSPTFDVPSSHPHPPAHCPPLAHLGNTSSLLTLISLHPSVRPEICPFDRRRLRPQLAIRLFVHLLARPAACPPVRQSVHWAVSPPAKPPSRPRVRECVSPLVHLVVRLF